MEPQPRRESNHDPASGPSEDLPPGRWGVLRQRNFQLLWSGQLVSMLGDQVHFIAAPWFVLQLTGSALALGTVLALGGVPRALFMLVGGAITDRFAARTILLGSTLLRMALTLLLAVLVWQGLARLWMLYAIALLFGIVDAFAFPAHGAFLPQLLPAQALAAGNALMQGAAQFTQLVGPALAGLLIALLGREAVGPDGESLPDMTGIALAFGFDAGTFLVGAVTLWLIRLPVRQRPALAPVSHGVWGAMREGVHYVARNPTLRGVFILVAAINLLFAGPIVVGIPVLANTRFQSGAAGFGVVMAAFGGGALVGTLLAGALPKPPPHRLGTLLLALTLVLGVGLAALGMVHSTVRASLVTLVMGASNGYVGVLYITWLQTRTPAAILGRVMSLMMFASVGLVPVSMAVSGALIQANTTGLLAASGALLVAAVLVSFWNPALRTMGLAGEAGAAGPLGPAA